MRLIFTVPVLNGWAVQSIGYNRYLPVGDPVILIETLDRWGADEILVQNMRSQQPNFQLLRLISQKSIRTPLTYSGGVRSVQDALSVLRMGADRIALDTLFSSRGKEILEGISKITGRQALLGVLPFVNNQKRFGRINSCSRHVVDIDDIDYLIDLVSEVILIDTLNEGEFISKNVNFPRISKIPCEMIIPVGSVLNRFQEIYDFYDCKIPAICIENYPFYVEHGVQKIRSGSIFSNINIRPFDLMRG